MSAALVHIGTVKERSKFFRKAPVDARERKLAGCRIIGKKNTGGIHMKKGMVFLLVMALLLLNPAAYSAKMLGPGDFYDTGGHWAEAEIRTACTNGLMQGVGVNENGQQIFAPDGQVTRAQLGMWLAKSFALDYGQIRFIKAPSPDSYFWDVDNDAWYANSAMLCAINGIFPAGQELHPEEYVTRIEVARCIVRVFTAKKINVPMIMLMPAFNDMEGLPREDVNAIVFVNNTGIMTGNGEMFCPDEYITRGELARIANRSYELFKMNPPGVKKMEPALQIGAEEIKTSDEYLEVSVEIPVIGGMKNTAAQQKINEHFKQVVQEQREELLTMAAENKRSAEEMDYPFHQYQLYARTGPYFENGKILSFYVDYYNYSGGAHGMTDRRTYNYDVVSGQALSLKDVFISGYDYKSRIDTAISGEISQNPDDFFEGEFGFKGIDLDHKYYLQNDALVLCFNQYEIAPYAAGIQEFRIPLQDFSKGLNPELKLIR